jgi:hypothetical protein
VPRKHEGRIWWLFAQAPLLPKGGNARPHRKHEASTGQQTLRVPQARQDPGANGARRSPRAGMGAGRGGEGGGGTALTWPGAHTLAAGTPCEALAFTMPARREVPAALGMCTNTNGRSPTPGGWAGGKGTAGPSGPGSRSPTSTLTRATLKGPGSRACEVPFPAAALALLVGPEAPRECEGASRCMLAVCTGRKNTTHRACLAHVLRAQA